MLVNRNYGTCNSNPDRTSPIPYDNKSGKYMVEKAVETAVKTVADKVTSVATAVMKPATSDYKKF